MTQSPSRIVSARPSVGRGRLSRGCATLAAAVVVMTFLAASGALAAARVSPAHGSTRSALVHAVAAQDGTSRGISGVFVAGAFGIVCQRTPDAGLVRFLFRHRGGAWHFAFSARGTGQGSTTQRRLERACH